MKIKSVAIVLAVVITSSSPLAWGYVGPGVGLSLVGSLLGLLLAVLVSVGAILLWPLRNFLRRRKIRHEQAVAEIPVGEEDND